MIEPKRGMPTTTGGPASNREARSARVPSSVDFGLLTPARQLIDELVALMPGQRLVVISDEAHRSIADALKKVAIEAKGDVELVELESYGLRPIRSCPEHLKAKLKGADATILLISPEDAEWDLRGQIREAAVAARAKHLHVLGMSRASFMDSLAIRPTRIFDFNQQLRLAIRPSSRLSVRSDSGTRLEIEMAPHLRWVVTGSAMRPGSWQNLPYGALASSPDKIAGTYVVDASVGGTLGTKLGLITPKPITLQIVDGRVKSVECRDVQLRSYVESFMRESPGQDRIGIINLGTNLGIHRPLGEVGHDRNMPGVHLSLGATFPELTGAKWTAQKQLAFAVASCEADLDGAPLIRRGRYVRFV